MARLRSVEAASSARSAVSVRPLIAAAVSGQATWGPPQSWPSVQEEALARHRMSGASVPQRASPAVLKAAPERPLNRISPTSATSSGLSAVASDPVTRPRASSRRSAGRRRSSANAAASSSSARPSTASASIQAPRRPKAETPASVSPVATRSEPESASRQTPVATAAAKIASDQEVGSSRRRQPPPP